MKKFIEPGFEFIFSVALIAILGLPPLVMGQSQKNIEIQIINNDTTVNGKNIQKLTSAERKDALDAINGLPPTPVTPGNTSGLNSKVVIKKRVTNGGKNDIVIERSKTDDQPQIADFDSSQKDVKIRLRKLRGADSAQAFTYRFDNDLPKMDTKSLTFNAPKHKQALEFNNRNSQTFNYSNTDNDGISTNISFRIADLSKDQLKRITGTENAELVINDLNLLPEFSTGKTTLSFSLPAKTAATVKLSDTNGKVLWADKALGGSFSKKMNLPLNGVYYLQIKQGTGLAEKKIIKE